MADASSDLSAHSQQELATAVENLTHCIVCRKRRAVPNRFFPKSLKPQHSGLPIANSAIHVSKLHVVYIAFTFTSLRFQMDVSFPQVAMQPRARPV